MLLLASARLGSSRLTDRRDDATHATESVAKFVTFAGQRLLNWFTVSGDECIRIRLGTPELSIYYPVRFGETTT